MKYQAKQIDTKLKGDKVVFTCVGRIYREKIGALQKIILGETFSIPVCSSNQVENYEIRFSSHATTVDFYRTVRESNIDMLRLPNVVSASHNVFAYRFTSGDGNKHEGSGDDMGRVAHSFWRKQFTQCSCSCFPWYGSKIGPRRFAHIKEAGIKALEKTLRLRLINMWDHRCVY